MRIQTLAVPALFLASIACSPRENVEAQPQPGQFFLTRAAQINVTETETGRMAQERASDPRVKQFAEKMVEDHNRANQELQRLAEKKGVKLPDRPDPAHAQTKSRLEQLQGAQFDREYMAAMVAGHTQAVNLFEEKARDASDPETQAYAQRMLPILKEHLQMAQELQKSLEGTGGASAR